MMQYWLQQNTHRLSRLFAALSRFDPRRAWRHFKSVSSRLNTIIRLLDANIRLLEAESAARVDRDRKATVLWEYQLAAIAPIAEIAEIAQRLGGEIATHVDRLQASQKAQAEEILSAITNSVDMIRSSQVDRWKFQEFEGLLRYLRRQEYLRAIRDGSLAVPRLETDHPVAISSNDTKYPRGSKNDNSIVPRFNHKLYQFLGVQTRLRVLDLGCAGGGFVRSLIDDGHLAVGLDGSDYPAQPDGGMANHTYALVYV